MVFMDTFWNVTEGLVLPQFAGKYATLYIYIYVCRLEHDIIFTDLTTKQSEAINSL